MSPPLGLGDAEVGDVDDVGMAQAAAGLRFALKASEELRFGGPFGGDHFDGDDARRAEMGGEVDVAHAAGAELFVDAVFAVEDIADHRSAPQLLSHDNTSFQLSERRIGRLEFHRYQFGDSRLLHGHAVERLRGFHGALGVRDDDELRLRATSPCIRRVRRSMLASSSGASTSSSTQKGLGLIVEDRHQQRHGGQRLLAAGEQQHVLQLLAGGRGDDVDAGFGQVRTRR